MTEDFIPFSRPSLSECEIESVTAVLRSGWWTTGKRVAEFEREFADYADSRHAIVVNSCTAGLHIALAAIGMQRNDAIVTSTYTFVATAEVALYLGAHPLLVDIDEQTLCIDAMQARRLVEALSDPEWRDAVRDSVEQGSLPRGCMRYLRLEERPNITTIVPVHFGGRAADMKNILDAAERHGLKVVEDAAHAVETWWGDRKVGGIGDATAFSFYATKNLSTGEGGMVTTNDDAIAEKMRRLSLHGISKDAWNRYDARGSWYYEVLEQGYKYNMTDLAAALGICQLRRIDEMALRRAHIAQVYTERLGVIESLVVPTQVSLDRRAWHLFTVRLRAGCLSLSRDQLIERLRDAGIGTSVHFIPVHCHPFYRTRYGYVDGDFPVAEEVYASTISLPLYPDLTDRQLDRICTTIERICKEHSN